MKFQFYKKVLAIACAIALGSCSNDDVINSTEGNGSLKLKFDHRYGETDFIMGATYTTSQGEAIKVDNIKYIVSNIVLTKDDGSTYTYPKSKSYFIIKEQSPVLFTVELADIPAGNYKSVKFGIGVDQEQFNLGAAGQGDFLAQAQAEGMMWSWSAGYKFLAFEGNFTSATVAQSTLFKVHTGQTGTNYNYTEVSLNFPDKALVRPTITPQVHVMADLSKILDGANKIGLSQQPNIMGGAILASITANVQSMFAVDHVHND